MQTLIRCWPTAEKAPYDAGVKDSSDELVMKKSTYPTGQQGGTDGESLTRIVKARVLARKIRD